MDVGVRISDLVVSTLLYADDAVLLAESPSELQTLVTMMKDDCQARGLHLNAKKTKVMVFEREETRPNTRIMVDDVMLEQNCNQLRNVKLNYLLNALGHETYNVLQACRNVPITADNTFIAIHRPRVLQIWFKRFQSGNFDITDARRSSRPVTDKIDAIFEKVEQDRHISSYDVAGELGIDHKTVLAHLKKAGYTKKLDIWVPHELTERNLMNRVLICDSL
ncbi:hypothetical protein K1T71_009068 [Dendrolimus kikuchii]|uniref:Uncharacterized protein n=1 Tax=Dendrolimus kikuchii TaxID=765133 RepID=A0ACC1CUJ5_9NEOP|nr:hypothetical protein K1T71_009068 [Dendrolimus kikuchii]